MQAQQLVQALIAGRTGRLLRKKTAKNRQSVEIN